MTLWLETKIFFKCYVVTFPLVNGVRNDSDLLISFKGEKKALRYYSSQKEIFFL